MNKRIAYLLLFLFSLVTAVSCKKDDPSAPPKPLSCQIDGKTWNSNLSSQAFYVPGTGGTQQISITGTDVVNTITILVPAKVGVYDLKDLTSGVTVTLVVAPASTFVSNLCISAPDGTVEITEIDTAGKTVSGKFTAKLCSATLSSKTITSGLITKVKIN